MSEPKLTPADLERFCRYLYDRTGMVYGESKRYYVERRLADRMRAVRERDFAAYFARLQADAGELVAFINAFTVNETYFYREDHQLRCLSANLLPELVRGRGAGDKVRIWSLPCSTGEEAYSIAIWLLENWPMVDAYHVEICGSDIDTAALAQARLGRYGERALSRLPAELVDRYFEAPFHGEREIIGDLKESVAFSPANLMEGSSLAPHGRFDVIFCRNVLIYFDDAARARAVDNLYTALQPGGFVCLGHSESMTRISDRFKLRRFADAVVYQRPEDDA
ncbi:protein-glutamate O-methyltransferase CheR [Phenylobacterium sp. J426]|uniref:CheR family methyltransferase n=1 Tax=Phenylobacterium sp. J426 TaxID=2898439 RepID=UPI002150F8AC|nr:protein-glutamate O-methyltransferase CheR [Phenylobacterium sp. J426]MCR5874531.1 protein-glutamate O-methyltransferase CheR [Phenylobacterium sp. J426]